MMKGAFKPVIENLPQVPVNKVTGGTQAPKQEWELKEKLQSPQDDSAAELRRRLREQKRWNTLVELRKAYDANMAELNQKESALRQEVQAKGNAAAGADAVKGRNLAEYAASHGLNGGTFGQAGRVSDRMLRESLAADHAKAEPKLADLALRRAEVEEAYQKAIAQAGYNGEPELAAALYVEMLGAKETLLDENIDRQKRALEWYRAQRAYTGQA